MLAKLSWDKAQFLQHMQTVVTVPNWTALADQYAPGVGSLPNRGQHMQDFARGEGFDVEKMKKGRKRTELFGGGN